MTRSLPTRFTRLAAATTAAALLTSAFASDVMAKKVELPSKHGNGNGNGSSGSGGSGSSTPAPAATATAFDLTATNTAGEVTIGGALYQRTGVQPTGTGVIDPFVRLQSPGSSTTESGFNTDHRPLQNDENNSPNFTRSVPLDDLGVFNLGGVDYYKLLLDLNEPNGGGNSLISLDEFELYQSSNAALTTYDPATKFGSAAALVYDLDALGDSYLKLDADIHSRGSGAGDMFAYVPTSLFSATGGDYLYLYSSFGTHFGAQGGFEEWAAIEGPEPQEPPTAIPLPPAAWTGLATMAAMLGGAGYRRYRAGRGHLA